MRFRAYCGLMLVASASVAVWCFTATPAPAQKAANKPDWRLTFILQDGDRWEAMLTANPTSYTRRHRLGTGPGFKTLPDLENGPRFKVFRIEARDMVLGRDEKYFVVHLNQRIEDAILGGMTDRELAKLPLDKPLGTKFDKASLNLQEKPWSQVLEWLTDSSGKPVVSSQLPGGTLTFPAPGDGKPPELKLAEIVEVLNKALATQKLKLVDCGWYYCMQRLDARKLARAMPFEGGLTDQKYGLEMRHCMWEGVFDLLSDCSGVRVVIDGSMPGGMTLFSPRTDKGVRKYSEADLRELFNAVLAEAQMFLLRRPDAYLLGKDTDVKHLLHDATILAVGDKEMYAQVGPLIFAISVGEALGGSLRNPLTPADALERKLITKDGKRVKGLAKKDEAPGVLDKLVVLDFHVTPCSLVFKWIREQTGLPIEVASEEPPTGSITCRTPVVDGKPKEQTLAEAIIACMARLEYQRLAIKRTNKGFVIVDADKLAKELQDGKLLKVEGGKGYLLIGEQFYGVHAGQSIEDALMRPLSDADVKKLGLK